MVGERYVGPTPTLDQDLVTKLTVANLIAAATPNRISAATDVTTSASGKATKTYVDTQDAGFVSPSYFQTQDALNIPTTSKGVASGVASLDGSGKIPLGQFPAIGSGFVSGPYGPTATSAQNATTTPVKIADWDIGNPATTFQPVFFGFVMATSSNYGRPVIELRISDGAQSYSFQTLVAIGYGRSNYNDEQAVVLDPAPGNPSQTGASNFPASMNVWLSAWLYDPTGNGVSVAADSIVSGAVYIVRDAE